MSIGLIGRKVGVTQVFQADGTMVAVSVVAIQPNTVTRLRTADRDGYVAVQLGSEPAKRLTKPEAGQLKNLPKAAQSLAKVREFRVDSVDGYELGQTVALGDLFAEGDLVDVTGVCKGKGFAGTIKRHNFSSGPKSHGSHNIRQPGSIGASATPSRVFKGMRMAGHMGDRRVTQRGLKVAEVDAERNLLLIAGPVLLVGNHSGGTWIADTFVFAQSFYDHFGPDRRFHQLAHDLVFKMAGLRTLGNRIEVAALGLAQVPDPHRGATEWPGRGGLGVGPSRGTRRGPRGLGKALDQDRAVGA